jgi:cytochrome c553
LGLCGVEGLARTGWGTVDSKAGAGWLGGQPAVYLRAQLEAISSGARHNDIGEHMGNIVR